MVVISKEVKRYYFKSFFNYFGVGIEKKFITVIFDYKIVIIGFILYFVITTEYHGYQFSFGL